MKRQDAGYGRKPTLEQAGRIQSLEDQVALMLDRIAHYQAAHLAEQALSDALAEALRALEEWHGDADCRSADAPGSPFGRTSRGLTFDARAALSRYDAARSGK